MKTIETKKLKVGDIFAKEIKLHGRKAYKLEEPIDQDKDTFKATCRTTGEEKRLTTKGMPFVVLLRSESD